MVWGVPNRPNDGTVDQIPCLGPVQVRMPLAKRPAKAPLALEKAKVHRRFEPGPNAAKGAGTLTAQIDQVRIHAVLVITG